MTHVNNVWVNTLSNKPKLHLYKENKTQYCTERYVLIGLRRSQRSVLAKLRLGVLQIHVESGRYKNTPRDQRCCFRYGGPIIFPSLFHIGLRPIKHN